MEKRAFPKLKKGKVGLITAEVAKKVSYRMSGVVIIFLHFSIFRLRCVSRFNSFVVRGLVRGACINNFTFLSKDERKL